MPFRRSRCDADAALLDAAESQWRASGVIRRPDDDLAPDREVRAVEAQLTGDLFQRAWNEGLAMSPSRAVSVALDEPN
jgi:hypothetical protein